MADFLTLDMLYLKVGAATIKQYLIDDGSTALKDTDPIVQDVLQEAEGVGYSRMLRHYGSREAITDYANNDAAYRGHIAWIAIQFASERRKEFTDATGAGAWTTQYDRAIEHIDLVSKGQLRGTGETATEEGGDAPGPGANTGGALQPKPPAATAANFVFAPSTKAPSGHGGF